MSGGFNPINMVSQIALGVATGGTSLFAQLAMQVVSSVIQEVIQKVGDEIGLPQPLIDTAQAAAAGSLGDIKGAAQNSQESAQGYLDMLGDLSNASPTQRGELQRSTDDFRSSVEDTVQSAWQNAERSGNAKGKHASWLQVIADSIGAAVDRKADELHDLAGKADQSREASTDYQVAVQEFSLLMNTLTTSIKSIGEALGNIARKQ